MSHQDDKTGILPVPYVYMKTLLPIVTTSRRIPHRSYYWDNAAMTIAQK
jgi:hypothetical protein